MELEELQQTYTKDKEYYNDILTRLRAKDAELSEIVHERDNFMKESVKKYSDIEAEGFELKDGVWRQKNEPKKRDDIPYVPECATEEEAARIYEMIDTLW